MIRDLAGAKELKLVSRLESDGNGIYVELAWAEPRLYAGKGQPAPQTKELLTQSFPAPLPGDTPVRLETLKDRVTSHKEITANTWIKKRREKDIAAFRKRFADRGMVFGPQTDPSMDGRHRGRAIMSLYRDALWTTPPSKIAFNIEGAGLKAFSAVVGITHQVFESKVPRKDMAIVFEVHVDGKTLASSGIMAPNAPPRFLLVDGLAGAKEIKLVSRFAEPQDPKSYHHGLKFSWADAGFYK